MNLKEEIDRRDEDMNSLCLKKLSHSLSRYICNKGGGHCADCINSVIAYSKKVVFCPICMMPMTDLQSKEDLEKGQDRYLCQQCSIEINFYFNRILKVLPADDFVVYTQLTHLRKIKVNASYD
jgi:hypothetical protein